MLLIYYSFTGNTERFVNKLDVGEGIDIVSVSDVDHIQDRFILVTPTYNIGQIPEEVKEFLEEHGKKMIGVIGIGNKSWGKTYGVASNKIAGMYDVPLLHKLEMSGNKKDIEIVENIIENLL